MPAGSSCDVIIPESDSQQSCGQPLQPWLAESEDDFKHPSQSGTDVPVTVCTHLQQKHQQQVLAFRCSVASTEHELGT